MKLFLTAVHDKKAKNFEALRFLPSEVSAVRDFEIAVRSTDSALCHYKEDFDLVCLGYIDSSSGVFEASDVTVLRSGVDVQ